LDKRIDGECEELRGEMANGLRTFGDMLDGDEDVLPLWNESLPE